MIDFTNAIEKFNNYQGSEKKKTLIYNNIKYLVKFPDPIMEKNKNISYINNAFSEYIGSNIFKMAEFEAQNTLLGKYYYKGKEKIVCACEDFTDNEHILYEFENLAINCYSCIKLNGKKINYMSFMQKMENKECNDAIKRKFKKVNINEIHFFIDGIESISNVRKKFYKEIISYRYNNLKNIYEKLKS